jgi:hypothetical protein
MAALPGTRVARMMGAVIDYLDGNGRERLLEGGANLAGAGGVRRSISWLAKKVAYHSGSCAKANHQAALGRSLGRGVEKARAARSRKLPGAICANQFT